MLKMKGMRFPKEIILVCIRWYAAYALSYRNLEEMMQERGVTPRPVGASNAPTGEVKVEYGH